MANGLRIGGTFRPAPKMQTLRYDVGSAAPGIISGANAVNRNPIIDTVGVSGGGIGRQIAQAEVPWGRGGPPMYQGPMQDAGFGERVNSKLNSGFRSRGHDYGLSSGALYDMDYRDGAGIPGAERIPRMSPGIMRGMNIDTQLQRGEDALRRSDEALRRMGRVPAGEVGLMSIPAADVPQRGSRRYQGPVANPMEAGLEAEDGGLWGTGRDTLRPEADYGSLRYGFHSAANGEYPSPRSGLPDFRKYMPPTMFGMNQQTPAADVPQRGSRPYQGPLTEADVRNEGRAGEHDFRRYGSGYFPDASNIRHQITLPMSPLYSSVYRNSAEGEGADFIPRSLLQMTMGSQGPAAAAPARQPTQGPAQAPGQSAVSPAPRRPLPNPFAPQAPAAPARQSTQGPVPYGGDDELERYQFDKAKEQAAYGGMLIGTSATHDNVPGTVFYPGGGVQDAPAAMPQSGAIPRSSSDTYLMNKSRGVVPQAAPYAPGMVPEGAIPRSSTDTYLLNRGRRFSPQVAAEPMQVSGGMSGVGQSVGVPAQSPFSAGAGDAFSGAANRVREGNEEFMRNYTPPAPGPERPEYVRPRAPGAQTYGSNVNIARSREGQPVFGNYGNQGQTYGGGLTADGVMSTAHALNSPISERYPDRMGAQPVDGRYAATAPGGYGGRGGEYMLPGPAGPSQNIEMGANGQYVIPQRKIDRPVGSPNIGAGETAYLPNGQQVVMLPGRSIPTLVPKGKSVEYDENNQPYIASGSLATPDPLYQNNTGVTGRSVSKVRLNEQGEPWGEADYRKAGYEYRARQADRAERRQDALMARRMGRPFNAGAGFGSASAPAITGGATSSSYSGDESFNVDGQEKNLYRDYIGMKHLSPRARYDRLRGMNYSDSEIRAFEKELETPPTRTPVTATGGGGDFAPPPGF